MKILGKVAQYGTVGDDDACDVNIIMGVRSLHTLRASIDTMGEEKTMDFIAAIILQHIKEIGECRVYGVSMDGSCKGVFVLIQKEFPWVLNTVWSCMRLVCSHGSTKYTS